MNHEIALVQRYRERHCLGFALPIGRAKPGSTPGAAEGRPQPSPQPSTFTVTAVTLLALGAVTVSRPSR